MKTVNFLSGVLLAMALSGPVCAAPADYHVVPMPQRVQLTKGAAFQLSDDVQILAAPNLPLLPFRMPPLLVARDAPRLFASFLLYGFREEVHRPAGTPQYESLPLASD